MPDGGTCSEQPCSIGQQCGCGTGMSCDVDIADNAGAACRTVTTPGREAASCNSLDDCDAGYVCLSNAYGGAACHKFCSADSECGTPRGKCAVAPKVNNVDITGVPNACSSNCDPLTNPSTTATPVCPANNKCTIYRNNGNPFVDCIPAGNGTQGDSCQDGNKGDETMCAPSYACTSVDGGGTFRCRKYCTNPGVGSSNQCGGRACNGFSPALSVAGVNYGYCSTL
jgi:hypothetical protein